MKSPKFFFNRPCHVAFLQNPDGFTQVSIDGKDVASITRANVSFDPDRLPVVSIALAPKCCDLDLPDATVVIERLDAHEPVQRALLEHLKAKFEPESANAAPAAAPRFPTMLRKMWSGREVQDWIDANWPFGITQGPAGAATVALADEWRPIKSAPRDGSNVMLRFGVDGVSQGKFVPGGVTHPWKFIDTNDGITWLVNHAVDGPGGPSHWQPMPSAIRGVAAVAPGAKVFTEDEIHAFYEAWEFNEADPGRLEFHSLVREIEHLVLQRARGVSGTPGGER